MIRFTFDLDKIFNDKQYNYSNTIKICRFDSTQFHYQNEVFGIIEKVIKGNAILETKLKSIKTKGICVPASIYNSYPGIFDYSIEQLCNFVYQRIMSSDKLFNIEKIVKDLNTIKQSALLRIKDNLNNSYNTAISYIDQDKPLIIIYQYEQQMWHNMPPHAISLFGIDNNKLVYFDSGEDILINSMIFYINTWIKRNDISQYKNNLLQDIKIETNTDNIKTLVKQLVGYEHNNETKLSAIDSKFLTNKTIFYDSNSIIVSEQQNFSEWFDNNIYGISFSDLTERLNKLRY